MNKLRFVLELVDRVSGPARKMTRALRSVNQGFRSIRRAVPGVSRDLMTFGSLTHMLYAQRLAKLHRGLKSISDSSVVTGINRLTDRFISLAKYGALAVGAFTGFVVGKAVSGFVDMAKHVEKTRLALASITGSRALGGMEFDRSAKLARRFGLSIKSVQQEYTKLRAMQFTQDRAETFIKLGADLRGAGLTDDEGYKRFLRAATQVQAKGRLQAEELNQQFSEAGVSVALVLHELQRPLGVKTNKEVQAAISNSDVSAEMGLAAIERAILRKTNQTEAGGLGGRALKKLPGILAQVKNAPEYLYARVLNAGGGGIDRLKDALRGVIDIFDNADVNKVGEFFASLFEGFKSAVPKIGDFLTGFGKGFSDMMESWKKAGGGGIDFVRVGELTAKAFGLVGEAVRMAGRAFEWLQTPTGMATVKFLGVIAVGAKVVGWAAGLTKGISELWAAFGKAPAAIGSVVSFLGKVVDKFQVVIGWLTKFPVLGTLLGFGGAAMVGKELMPGGSIDKALGGGESLNAQLERDRTFDRLGGNDPEASKATMSKPESGFEAFMRGFAGQSVFSPKTEINVQGNPDPEQIAKEVERANRDAFDLMNAQGAY